MLFFLTQCDTLSLDLTLNDCIDHLDVMLKRLTIQDENGIKSLTNSIIDLNEHQPVKKNCVTNTQVPILRHLLSNLHDVNFKLKDSHDAFTSK